MSKYLSRLRVVALIAGLAGAACSLALMLRAGRRNNSQILLVLMAIWVLSPFVALAWANSVSTRWSVTRRATLYSVTLFVTLASSVIYGINALKPPRTQAAFVFVVVPPASWLLVTIAVPLAALISVRLLPRREGA